MKFRQTDTTVVAVAKASIGMIFWYERMVETKAVRVQRTCSQAPICLCLLLLFTLLGTNLVSAQSDTPVGVWLDASKRIQVQIFPCGDRLCGKIVWFEWPNDEQGLPLVDLKNENPELRSRPLLGLVVLRGLTASGENTWMDGKIYNPEDGMDYGAEMSIQDNSALRVRVYVLQSVMGETQIWTRVR
ncbi:MAG: DUF2147 domain-containing protein [Salaquimonas sp.]|nr:DUF2147 domain-containing protein [Salaquimonas sp.]